MNLNFEQTSPYCNLQPATCNLHRTPLYSEYDKLRVNYPIVIHKLAISFLIPLGQKPGILRSLYCFFKEFSMKKKISITRQNLMLCPVIGLLSVIAFSLTGCGTVSSGSAGNFSNNVIIYDQATLRDLKRVTEDGLSKDWISVSPDGSMLLYCESLISLNKWTDISNERVKSYQIMLLKDAEKPAKTHVVTDSSISPTWFNNETFVYSVIEGGIPKLIKSNIAGGGKIYITRNAVGQYDILPCVRGNLILCETDINKKKQMLRMTETGTDITVLGEGGSPYWHPKDPQKFLFTKNGDIYEMDLNTYQPTKLYGEANFPSAYPKYSSDGNYILFQKQCLIRSIDSKSGKALETKRWQVFVIKVNGTDLVQLTDGNVDVYSPAWGKDNKVFFMSNANNSTEIWNANVNLW
jgi:TolB protein